MKKTLFAIALIASLTAGSALQANEKPAKQPAAEQWYAKPTIVPTKQITDPKELNKQIRDINGKIRKAINKRNRFVNDRTRAANKGDQKRVQELIGKIRAKDAQIIKHRALLRMYTMRLVIFKAREMKKEEAKEAKKKAKDKKKKEEPKKKAKEPKKSK